MATVTGVSWVIPPSVWHIRVSCNHFLCPTEISLGPGIVVGIATGYRLDGPGIESQWGARYSAPVQMGPGLHSASCTMGTGSLPGVKSCRGMTLTPHPLLVLWSWKGRVIPLLPPMGRTSCTEPQCLYKGELYLLLTEISYSVRLK